MQLEEEIALEVDGVLNAWRSRALSVLLIVGCALILPPLLVLLSGRAMVVPWPVHAVCVFLYALLLAAALRPGWGLKGRSLVLLLCVATLGAIQLAVGRLEGNGRLALLMPPFLALVLMGPAAGWVTMAVCACLFAGVPLLLQFDSFARHVPAVGSDMPLSYWLLQWLLWVNSVALLMILLSRFERLQRQTMINERLALRRLEEAGRDRQRLAREVDRIGEMERRRLGAELHDGLCQHLAATLLNCAAVEACAKTSGKIGSSDFAKIHSLVKESIDMAYDVSRGLCPVDLDPEALVPALEQLCRSVQERHAVECVLEADFSLAVSDSTAALNLYRIAGEAVANAVKHARCARIGVSLMRERGELVLRIEDDGKEASPTVGHKGGLGVGIMAYRAELVGGRLETELLPGGGRRVTCRVPELEDLT